MKLSWQERYGDVLLLDDYSALDGVLQPSTDLNKSQPGIACIHPQPVLVRVFRAAYPELKDDIMDLKRSAQLLKTLGGDIVPPLVQAFEQDGAFHGFVERAPDLTVWNRPFRKARRTYEPAPLGWVLHVAGQVTKVFAAAERHNPQWRLDLRPQDIMLTPKGEVIVRPLPYPNGYHRNFPDIAGAIRQDWRWLTPAQVRGIHWAPLDNQYQIGLLMYEGLTGQPAFKGETAFEILTHIIQVGVPEVTEVLANLPRQVVQVIQRTTQPGRNEPFASYAELAATLEDLKSLYRPFGPKDRAQLLQDRMPDLLQKHHQLENLMANVDFNQALASWPKGRETPYALQAWPRTEDTPVVPFMADDETPTEYFSLDTRMMLHIDEHLAIDARCVTHAEYARFVIDAGHPPPPTWKGVMPHADHENDPVTMVSFDDAYAYAEWAGKRLPTNAEWNHAVNVLGKDRLQTGEVWEWTRTRLLEYGFIVRGGVYRDRPHQPAHPDHLAPESQPAPDVGFRCIALHRLPIGAPAT